MMPVALSTVEKGAVEYGGRMRMVVRTEQDRESLVTFLKQVPLDGHREYACNWEDLSQEEQPEDPGDEDGP